MSDSDNLPVPPGPVLDRLRTILSELSGAPPEEIHLDTALREDLALDGFDFENLVLSIEDEWNLEITEQQLDDAQNVQDLVTLIEKPTA